MTAVYLFRREKAPLPEEAAALLPDWRRQRLEALRHAGARQESLAAGLLFVHAMGAWGVPANRPVRLLPAGKPVFSGPADVYFSMSHSGEYAMCAVSAAPVGADVQRLRPVKPSLFRRFHPEEQQWLSCQTGEQSQAAFFRLWTRKEAWVKARSDAKMLSLSEADVLHGLPGMYFRDYILPGGYAAAVCAGEADIPAPVPVTREELLAACPPG